MEKDHIFYIGKGKIGNYRASSGKRNEGTNIISEVCGKKIQIIKDDLTEERALEEESRLLKAAARHDHILTNRYHYNLSRILLNKREDHDSIWDNYNTPFKKVPIHC